MRISLRPWRPPARCTWLRVVAGRRVSAMLSGSLSTSRARARFSMRRRKPRSSRAVIRRWMPDLDLRSSASFISSKEGGIPLSRTRSWMNMSSSYCLRVSTSSSPPSVRHAGKPAGGHLPRQCAIARRGKKVGEYPRRPALSGSEQSRYGDESFYFSSARRSTHSGRRNRAAAAANGTGPGPWPFSSAGGGFPSEMEIIR